MAAEGSATKATLQSIESRQDAMNALKMLEAAGCPWWPVVNALYFYCTPIPKAPGQNIDVGARDVKQIVARTLKMSSQLRNDADELDAILKRLDETTPYAIHLKLPWEMRETAAILEKFMRGYRGKRLAISGRTSSLVYLVHLITEATGSRHYEEIATLVSAVQQEPQGKRVPTAQSIERKFLRFESSDPSWASLLRRQAISDVQELKQKSHVVVFPDANA